MNILKNKLCALPQGAKCFVIVDVCRAQGGHHGCLGVATWKTWTVKYENGKYVLSGMSMKNMDK